MKKLLVASTNAGKIREFKKLFFAARPDIEIVGLDSWKNVLQVEETADTFLGNALLKAKAYAEFSGLPTVSDDSGLSVDALRGEPGVFSARYAGAHATDEQNCEKVLRNLEGIPYEKRSAHFTCALVLFSPNGTQALEAQAEMHGFIHHQAQGSLGFGYDPIFWLPELKKTLAELEPDEKNRISHRRKALETLLAKVV